MTNLDFELEAEIAQLGSWIAANPPVGLTADDEAELAVMVAAFRVEECDLHLGDLEASICQLPTSS